MDELTASDLIQKFNLKPLPQEGGFYAETYKCPIQVGNRICSSAIYFLLNHNDNSNLHRLKSDEVWHFYLGNPLAIVEFHKDGSVRKTTLGRDILNGQAVQHTVPAGVWFGSHPLSDSGYSFVGCTVSPGFDFEDFEMAKREDLLLEYPHARKEIERLTNQTI